LTASSGTQDFPEGPLIKGFQEGNIMIIDKITESGMDAFMTRADKWSRVLAWAAVAAAVVFILLPALVTIWTR